MGSWTTEEIGALEASIKHWEEDILKPLGVEGCVVRIAPWNSAYIEVFGIDYVVVLSDTAKYCPLCELFHTEAPCPQCPYKIFYGVRCDNEVSDEDSPYGHWYLWRHNPSVETAKEMIKALKRILEGGDGTCQ